MTAQLEQPSGGDDQLLGIERLVRGCGWQRAMVLFAAVVAGPVFGTTRAPAVACGQRVFEGLNARTPPGGRSVLLPDPGSFATFCNALTHEFEQPAYY